MTMKRICTLLLCTILMMNLLMGCGKKNISEDTSSNNQKATTEAKKKDSSSKEKKEELKPVDLVIYMLGDAPKDKDLVLEKLNELTKRDLNATVTIKQTTWTDWQTKYNLLLTTGEQIDLITTHTWCDFFKYANQGAYMSLDELLPEYAPKTWASIPKTAWQDCTINGNIYTVPSNFYEFTQHNIIYRDDLRQKYGLEEIKTMDDMYNFLDMVAQKEKGMKPFNWDRRVLFMQESPLIPLSSSLDRLVAAKDYNHPRDLVLIPFTETYTEGIQKVRKLFNKGYWSESILSSDTTKDFENGLTAAIGHNIMWAKGLAERVAKAHPEWEVKYLNITHKDKIYPVVSNSNGMAIPRTAKNPERALMLLDKLRNDKEYYDLSQYGIRGVHYDENDAGEFMLPEGVTESGFPVEGFCSWSWRTNEFFKQTANGWSEFTRINDAYKSMANPNMFDAFYFDPYPIQAELAAVQNVQKQYGDPLLTGLVDPDEGLILYQEKLKEAGCDKILEEVQKQFNAYLDARGVQ